MEIPLLNKIRLRVTINFPDKDLAPRKLLIAVDEEQDTSIGRMLHRIIQLHSLSALPYESGRAGGGCYARIILDGFSIPLAERINVLRDEDHIILLLHSNKPVQYYPSIHLAYATPHNSARTFLIDSASTADSAPQQSTPLQWEKLQPGDAIKYKLKLGYGSDSGILEVKLYINICQFNILILF